MRLNNRFNGKLNSKQNTRYLENNNPDTFFVARNGGIDYG